MAKKPIPTAPLTFVEIVMRADAETIKAAYEARLKVDALLKEREEAYRRIAELENQVESIMGEPGVFVFPEPPLPVAGMAKTPTAAAKKKKTPAPAPAMPTTAMPTASTTTDTTGAAHAAGKKEPPATSSDKSKP
ncbi:MAG TPA: hypothetical protein PLT23_08760 [Lentisphaeria bacterium]|nr:hypothetical protein [Lentisphaeria bacterium]